MAYELNCGVQPTRIANENTLFWSCRYHYDWPRALPLTPFPCPSKTSYTDRPRAQMRTPFPGHADTIMTGLERFHSHPFLVQAKRVTQTGLERK